MNLICKRICCRGRRWSMHRKAPSWPYRRLPPVCSPRDTNYDASGKYQHVRGGVVVSITKVAIRVPVRSDTSSAARLSSLVKCTTVAHSAGCLQRSPSLNQKVKSMPKSTPRGRLTATASLFEIALQQAELERSCRQARSEKNPARTSIVRAPYYNSGLADAHSMARTRIF